MILVSVIIGLLGLFWWGWYWYMSFVTFRERMDMLPVPGEPCFWEKMERFKSVREDEHFWARLTFKDPMKLYERYDRENRSSL